MNIQKIINQPKRQLRSLRKRGTQCTENKYLIVVSSRSEIDDFLKVHSNHAATGIWNKFTLVNKLAQLFGAHLGGAITKNEKHWINDVALAAAVWSWRSYKYRIVNYQLCSWNSYGKAPLLEGHHTTWSSQIQSEIWLSEVQMHLTIVQVRVVAVYRWGDNCGRCPRHFRSHQQYPLLEKYHITYWNSDLQGRRTTHLKCTEAEKQSKPRPISTPARSHLRSDLQVKCHTASLTKVHPSLSYWEHVG